MQISNLKKVFGSNAKSQEMLLLLKGLKDVVRHGYYDNEFIAVDRFCKDKDIFIVKSDFKIVISDKGQYSNKGVKTSVSDPNGMHFVYMSFNKDKAELAKVFEDTQNHKELGLLLGYPECCVDFFCVNFSEENVDLQHEVVSSPYTNLTRRGDDYVILSHFPCSSKCNESIGLAKKYFDCVKEFDPEHADELMKNLSE